MILVVGASGTLGSRVCGNLLARGLPVRATSRAPAEKLGALAAAGAETARADLRDRASLVAVLRGVRTVVESAHGFFPPTRGNTVVDVDLNGSCSLIDAAAEAGVEHFVLVSGLHAARYAPNRFGRAKFEAEQHLRGSGVPATVVRPTVFMEAHALMMIGEPLRASGKVQIFGRGNTPLNFVCADRVAEVVAQIVAEGPRGDGMRVVGVGGPASLTRLEALEILERSLGRTAQRRHVPVSAMKAMRVLTRPISPALSYMVDFMISENTAPEFFRWEPGPDDVVSPTTLEVVAEAWAADGARTSA